MEDGDIKKASSEEYKGKVYYFCSEHCKKTFKKDPASYAHAEAQPHGEGEGHKH
ncbi:MAG: YHS domain-containing protein [Planctomycetes bacterium]|nr:YHS domain-containing protein [Planctomycetota bacterium]